MFVDIDHRNFYIGPKTDAVNRNTGHNGSPRYIHMDLLDILFAVRGFAAERHFTQSSHLITVRENLWDKIANLGDFE